MPDNCGYIINNWSAQTTRQWHGWIKFWRPRRASVEKRLWQSTIILLEPKILYTKLPINHSRTPCTIESGDKKNSASTMFIWLGAFCCRGSWEGRGERVNFWHQGLTNSHGHCIGATVRSTYYVHGWMMKCQWSNYRVLWASNTPIKTAPVIITPFVSDDFAQIWFSLTIISAKTNSHRHTRGTTKWVSLINVENQGS